MTRASRFGPVGGAAKRDFPLVGQSGKLIQSPTFIFPACERMKQGSETLYDGYQ